MAQVKNALIIIEAVLAVLLMAGVLIQTPKATGLGGTIGGGGDGLGGGYRTRRGLERQGFWATLGLARALPVFSPPHNLGTTTPQEFRLPPPWRRGPGRRGVPPGPHFPRR